MLDDFAQAAKPNLVENRQHHDGKATLNAT